jgi:hypothetical protein
MSQSIYALAVSGTNLFAGTYGGGVYLSTNDGNSWTAVNSGLTSKYVYALAFSGTNLFAGTNGNGVFLSTNNGNSWTAAGLSTQTVKMFAVSGTNIFAGTGGGGVFLTTNNGTNWTAVNNGLTNLYLQALTISGTNIFAGTQSAGAFLSTNNGSNWTAINSGLTTTSITAFAVLGSNIFVGTSGWGVYKSTNNGTNWTVTGMAIHTINVLAVSGTALIAGTLDSGIYSSTNNGSSWFKRNQGFDVSPTVLSLAISNNNVFAGIRYYCVFRRSLTEVIGIHNISTEIPAEFSLSQNYPNPFNPTTKIKFEIPAHLSFPNASIGNLLVSLKIFDILGREVQTLVNESIKPGTYEASFDGSSLTSGVYFYRLTTEGFSETKKMILMK